jgi:hypothetical protein
MGSSYKKNGSKRNENGVNTRCAVKDKAATLLRCFGHAGTYQVVFAKLNDLFQDFRLDIGKWHFGWLGIFVVVVFLIVLHRLDQFGHGGDGQRDGERLSLFGDLWKRKN